jgi:hypothetical protein
MFVNIVGHAIFQTAGRSGPSTIDRSYFRRSETGGAALTDAAAAVDDGGEGTADAPLFAGAGE